MALAGSLSMCRKDLPEPVQQVATENVVAIKIQTFIRKAANPVRTKSNVEYTKEEALWLVEAALNYGEVDPEELKKELEYQEFEVEVPVVNDKVSESDASDTYTALKAMMDAAPLSANQKLVAVDVVVKTENGVVTFKTYRVVGKVDPQETTLFQLNTEFTTSARTRQGVTEHGSVNACGTGRADVDIPARVNWTFGLHQVNDILTDVEIWHVWGSNGGFVETPDLAMHILPITLFPNPNDPDGVPPVTFGNTDYNDYLVYLTPPSNSSSTLDTEPCLAPMALSFLTQGLRDVVDIVQQDYVENPYLVPISCIITGYQLPVLVGTNSSWRYLHNVDIVYGRWQHGGPCVAPC